METPKDTLSKAILEAINKFETETGAKVHCIKLRRIEDARMGEYVYKTSLYKLDFDLK